MTAAVAAPPRKRDSRLTGVSELLKLNARTDRLRVAIWFLALTLIVWGTVPALEAAYPDPGALQARAALLSNPSAIMMTGPAFGVDDYTIDVMTVNELGLSLYVAVAIMSILLMVRHTRAEEESGRTELLRSGPLGRHAPLVAAVLSVFAVNVLVGAGIAIAMLLNGFEAPSSWAFGASMTLTGMVFGAVAAVTAQVARTGRGATGLALAFLGAAFLIRGIGDVIDSTGSPLSWFSPIAWAQQTRLYVELRWWPLALSLAAACVLLALGFVLARHRDVDSGLIAPSPGRSAAGPMLLSRFGLPWRLMRFGALAWALALALCALAFGALADSIEPMLADMPPELFALFGSGDLTNGFAAVMIEMLMLGVLAFAISHVIAFTREEAQARAAHVYVAGWSRVGVLARWACVVALLAMALALVSGASLGLGMSMVLGEWLWVGDCTIAALAHLPALVCVVGVMTLLVGALPSWSAVAWLWFGYIAFVTWFGDLFDLPDWANGVSPLHYSPQLPGGDAEAVPLVVLTLIGLAAAAVGLTRFARRDLRA